MNLPAIIKEFHFFTKFELMKIVRQGRLLTGMAILLLFVFLCALGAQLRLYSLERRGRHQLRRHNIQEVINTVSFSTHCLPPAMDVLFPILIGIFCASVFAGEFETGIIRTLAIRPISRTSLLLGKFAAMTIYIVGFLLLLWVSTFIVGSLMFEFSGDVYIWGEPFRALHHKGYILAEADAWHRYLIAYASSVLTLISLVGIFMVFSVIFKKFTPAASVPIGIYFVSLSLEKVPYFRPVRTYLPTYYFAFWKYLMHEQIQWQAFWQSLIIMLLMGGLSLVAGIYIFKSADI